MSLFPLHISLSSPNKAEAGERLGRFGVSRILLAAISIATCVSAPCYASSDFLAKKSDCVTSVSWQSLGNNGGKVDRFVLGRSAVAPSAK
jgi:hypothetical protein